MNTKELIKQKEFELKELKKKQKQELYAINELSTPGERLRFYRHKKGLSLASMSKESGISRTTINKLENGQQIFSIKNILFLAEFFGISTWDLDPFTMQKIEIVNKKAGGE